MKMWRLSNKYSFIILLCLFVNTKTNANDYQLPKIYLSGSFGYDYQEGNFLLILPDGTKTDTLTAKIKWRGGSTNVEGKHKRNYKIKFTDDQQFFGMRSDNNWILDAGQADIFRLRNRIATELWNDFATKPYYYNQEPKVMSGVRGKVVEVYLNNEYRGIYSFTECMDRKQLRIKKFDSKTNEIKGGLWKSEGYGDALMWQVSSMYDNKSDKWGVFEVKYPELDDIEETDYSTLYNAINFVANSNDDEFKNHVADYFDIPVIIDYYIFLHTLNAFDNVGKNMYWAVYDKTQNKKLTLAVWDLDGTIGASWLGDWSVPDYNININLNLIVRLKELNVNGFNERANERYHQLRNNILSTDNIIKRYYDYYELLKKSGAADREEDKWSKDSDIDGKEIYFDKEIDYIKNWILQHMTYLDTYIFPSSTGIKNNITTYPNISILYNMNGQRIYQRKKGLYIKNGKKYVIK